jgi:hypothetical protein
MLDNAPEDAGIVDATTEPAERGRRAAPDRSEIAFPYVNLEEAMALARALHENGLSLSRDQLASVLGTTPTGGSFSLRLGAARMFGLLENADGRQTLTDLGSRLLSDDDAEARQAKKEAFLLVPLYKRVWTEFRGKQLPPRPHGIENAFVSFGVAPRQKDKARQAFDKSATFAGFFPNGRDRLVEPIINGGAVARATPDVAKEEPEREKPRGKPNTNGATDDPLIHGLLIRLPAPGEVWGYDKRVRWLQILANNFEMVYRSNDDPESQDVSVIEVKRLEL